MSAKVGDTVEYKGDDSYFIGEVVALFTKKNGTTQRCVVENKDGVLFIKNPSRGKIITKE